LEDNMSLVLKLIIFSFLINWVVGLQMINQFSSDKNTKIISVTLSLVLASLAALVILL